MQIAGTSIFAYGVHLHQPAPISGVTNTRDNAASAAARAARIGGDLRAASAGVPAASISNLRPPRA